MYVHTLRWVMHPLEAPATKPELHFQDSRTDPGCTIVSLLQLPSSTLKKRMCKRLTRRSINPIQVQVSTLPLYD
ncbi:hypothetical protein Y1Q_0007880 [Alligator mississippiensis]|uniref:Uncharacterized protein n=1 Tax=Alligator mississippiensis TaxID=8496 RepID=A0A151NEQ0_ALLMI|nr:hypothetical protein Y1Q_0007880 [Alligator mississippiensis]